jgi:hypothetical protein
MNEDREEYHDWATPEASRRTIERRFQGVLLNNSIVSVTMKSPNPHNLSEVEWLKICIIQLDRVNRDLVKLARLAPPAPVSLDYPYAGVFRSGHQPSAYLATSAAPGVSSPPSTAVEPVC